MMKLKIILALIPIFTIITLSASAKPSIDRDAIANAPETTRQWDIKADSYSGNYLKGSLYNDESFDIKNRSYLGNIFSYVNGMGSGTNSEIKLFEKIYPNSKLANDEITKIEKRIYDNLFLSTSCSNKTMSGTNGDILDIMLMDLYYPKEVSPSTSNISVINKWYNLHGKYVSENHMYRNYTKDQLNSVKSDVSMTYKCLISAYKKYSLNKNDILKLSKMKKDKKFSFYKLIKPEYSDALKEKLRNLDNIGDGYYYKKDTLIELYKNKSFIYIK